MTTQTFQTNTFAKGMNCDVDRTLVGDDQYEYAENIRLITNDQGTTGVLLNIEGVKIYNNAQIPSDEVLIGCTVINKLAILITKVVNNGIYVKNKIYRVEGFDTDLPVTSLVCQGDLKLCEDLDHANLSLVGNYETNINIKVYFTDGKTSVKLLNVVDGKYVGVGPSNPLLNSQGDILNPLALDITPGASLPPFEIVDTLYGNLPSGVILYCYQLFNLRSSETTLSTLSPLIHLTDSVDNQTIIQYYGQGPNKSSGKSCVLRSPLYDHDFQKCRIISISYSANNQLPMIRIVDEIDLDPLQTVIEYRDSGNATMSVLTVEEFNQLTGYLFIANTITKMDNRLFAANVQEDSWNPTYDARAYRSSISGRLLLNSTNSANDISVVLPANTELRILIYKSIPERHDCINPFNSMQSSDLDLGTRFEYSTITSSGIQLKGGSGINIDYTFITAATYAYLSGVGNVAEYGLPLADMPRIFSKGTSDENVGLSVNSMPVDGIASINPLTNLVEVYKPFTYPRNMLPNYANPIIAGICKSLLRDEVYRYGIILYNKKHVPSPVKWIGDVRMPHASDRDYSPFYPSNKYINGRPLGIKFNVRNLPEDCIAFEIVRCDRTEADRSIILLAAMSITCRNDMPDEQGGMGGSLDTRPYILLSYAEPIGTVTYPSTFSDEFKWEASYLPSSSIKSDYITLTSPEISFSGLDIEKSFKGGTYLDTIYALASPIGDVLPVEFISKPVAKKRIGSSASKAVRDKDGAVIAKNNGTGAIVKDDSGRDLITIGVNIDYDDYTTDSIISKYFVPFGLSGRRTPADDFYFLAGGHNCTILEVKYPKLIPYNGIQDKSPYYQTVGEIAYLNFAQATWGGDIYNHGGTANKYGMFGPCLVAHSKNVRSTIRPISMIGNSHGNITWGKDSNYNDRNDYTHNAIMIANVKKNTNPYGGNTFGARQNSIYISTSTYAKAFSTSTTVVSYGGDTFLNILDLSVVTVFLEKNPEDAHEGKLFVGAYIPFESSINLNLAYGDAAHRTWRSGDNFIDVFALLDPGLMGSYHTLDAPYFAYNSTYSTQPGSKKFISASIYAESNVKTPNRIVCSEAKTSNEINDNWSIFKFANYLDVDNQYGDITNLEAFKGKLFFWLDTALGIASVNERSLIQDNNVGSLVLGTGGILTRADYITISNGSSIINDRSIVTSDSTIYWYDFDKNEICSYGNGVDQISKTKGVQSYLNEMYSNKRNVTLSLYDKKYNEVWFKFYDKSLIFNEQLGLFTSFYTFNPQWALLFSDKVVSIKDNKYYIINTLDTDNLGEVNKNARVRFIVNKDGAYTKTFDNVFFSGEFKNPNTVNELEAANSIIGKKGNIVYNTKDLFAHPYLIDGDAAIDYREYTYRFAIGREELELSPTYHEIADSYAGRMKGKYLVCDYTFDCNDNKTFKLPYINTTYRYSLV